MRTERKNKLIRASSIIALLALWETVGRLGIVDVVFTSKPTDIFFKGILMLQDSEFYAHLIASLESLAAGFLLAIFFGILAGLLIGFKQNVREFFSPYVYILSSLPMVAMMPLIIIWFGVGMISKIVIVFFMCFIPITLNTLSGVANTDKNLLKMAQSFGAGNFSVLRSVVFYNSLPFIFSGLRVAVGRSVIALVVSEIFGYGKGLGYLISFYGSTFQTAKLMFVLCVLLAISLIMTALVSFFEKKIITWNK